MPIYVTYQDGVRAPLSKGILSQQLITVGVKPEIAYAVAQGIQTHLRKNKITEVDIAELNAHASKALTDEVSAETAKRWERWSYLNGLGIPVIVMITGGNGTGKSTLAAQLGLRLGINRLTSTDSIREVMRELSVQALVPQLYQSSYRVEPPPGARKDDPIAGFIQQSHAVNIGIQAIIKRAAREHTSLILEGIHLLPSITANIKLENCALVPVTLIVPDARDHHERFSLRETETAGDRPSGDYLPYFKQIRAIHDYLVSEGLVYGHEIVDTTDLDQSLPPLVDRIIAALEQAAQ